MKILVVDDEYDIREIFRNWLKQENFTVYEAENGREAVKTQKATPVDLIICDLIMPVQEGIETITQFKNDFPDVGIIAVSGGGQTGPDTYLTMAEHLGAWKVFAKPVERQAIISAIYEWKEKYRPDYA